jgi:hypothetical protein
MSPEHVARLMFLLRAHVPDGRYATNRKSDNRAMRSVWFPRHSVQSVYLLAFSSYLRVSVWRLYYVLCSIQMNTKWNTSYVEVISTHLFRYFTFSVLDGYEFLYLNWVFSTAVMCWIPFWFRQFQQNSYFTCVLYIYIYIFFFLFYFRVYTGVCIVVCFLNIDEFEMKMLIGYT